MIPKLTNAIPKPNYILNLEFDNKIWKSFSVEPYFKYPVFKLLADELFFRNLKVKYNTVVWGQDEDIDFDPYTFWMESIVIEVKYN